MQSILLLMVFIIFAQEQDQTKEGNFEEFDKALIELTWMPAPQDSSACNDKVKRITNGFPTFADYYKTEAKMKIIDGLSALQSACRWMPSIQTNKSDWERWSKSQWLTAQVKLMEGTGFWLKATESTDASTPAPNPPQGTIKEFTGTRKFERQGTNIAVFNHQRDPVWVALIEALASSNIQPKSLDKDSGLIIFQTEWTWGSTWGDANRAVTLMTTKSVGSISTWQAFLVSGNVFCKQVNDSKTELHATFQFAGYNGFAAWLAGAGAGWQRLESNGWFEDKIFNAVAERLPDPMPPRQLLVASFNPRILTRAREVLLAFRKVESAIELAATQPEIMREMVAARALLQDFSDSADAAAIPRFVAKLNVVEESLRTANTDAVRRTESLQTARNAMKDAAKELDLLSAFTAGSTTQ